MKSEELMRAMSGVLPEFIDDAVPGRKRRRVSPWLKWVSAAACLVYIRRKVLILHLRRRFMQTM